MVIASLGGKFTEQATTGVSVSHCICLSLHLSRCKDIGVVRFFADTYLTKGAALSEHPSAVLNTSRGCDLP